MENTRMMRRKTREQRRKLMRKQKLYGLVFVLPSIMICLVCATGKTPEDRDATAVVLLLPFGLYLIFTKDNQNRFSLHHGAKGKLQTERAWLD